MSPSPERPILKLTWPLFPPAGAVELPVPVVPELIAAVAWPGAKDTLEPAWLYVMVGFGMTWPLLPLTGDAALPVPVVPELITAAAWPRVKDAFEPAWLDAVAGLRLAWLDTGGEVELVWLVADIVSSLP